MDVHIDSSSKTLFCVHMSISTSIFSEPKSLTSQLFQLLGSWGSAERDSKENGKLSERLCRSKTCVLAEKPVKYVEGKVVDCSQWRRLKLPRWPRLSFPEACLRSGMGRMWMRSRSVAVMIASQISPEPELPLSRCRKLTSRQARKKEKSMPSRH
jgi:hypothetical protein